MTDSTDLARRLFDAIEAGDLPTVRDAYDPTATIWHNTDNRAKPVSETLQLIEWLTTNLPPMRYVDRHCSATEDGFVQRHTVVITRPDGGQVHLPCCVVATVTDGRIAHLYEYFDGATQSETEITIPAG